MKRREFLKRAALAVPAAVAVRAAAGCDHVPDHNTMTCVKCGQSRMMIIGPEWNVINPNLKLDLLAINREFERLRK
jgi:hypothetical protein